jgi:hypothetical protein
MDKWSDSRWQMCKIPVLKFYLNLFDREYHRRYPVPMK